MNLYFILLPRLSGADIARICKEAKHKSVDRLTMAEFFVTVTVGGENFYTPCEADNKNRVKMSVMEIPSDRLLFRTFLKQVS